MESSDDERRAFFLEYLSETANVTESAKAAGISRRTVYFWREGDEDFAKAWDEAVELGTDALEDEAVRRGRDGVDEPVFYRGQECGSVRRYSDTLLIFMLKARRPGKFKDRLAAEHSGPEGGPIELRDVPDDELVRRIAETRARIAAVESKLAGDGGGAGQSPG